MSTCSMKSYLISVQYSISTTSAEHVCCCEGPDIFIFCHGWILTIWWKQNLILILSLNNIEFLDNNAKHGGCQWRRHGGMGGPDPPLLFRPLLRLAQIRWKVFFYIWGIPCMYIVTFTAHQQRNMVRTPPLFGLAKPLVDATSVQITFVLSRGYYNFHLLGESSVVMTMLK